MTTYKNFAIFLLALLTFSCAENRENGTRKKLLIVTTTGMIGDALANVAGDSAEVVSLMGAGVDPHLYKATQGDLQKLNNADIIFYNGLHLEGKMGEVLEKLAQRKPVVALGEGSPHSDLRIADTATQTHDPHIWFDVALWKKAVQYASKKLQEYDTTKAKYYQQNTLAYAQRLDSLHQETQVAISQIPQNQRVLITSHDAFGYFGRAYGIEVRGLQGISTVAEFGLKDVAELVNFIVERKIKAVFVESSVSDKSIQAVLQGCRQRGHQINIGGTLFSDAMGATGTPEGTYLGMVRANVSLITKALY